MIKQDGPITMIEQVGPITKIKEVGPITMVDETKRCEWHGQNCDTKI